MSAWPWLIRMGGLPPYGRMPRQGVRQGRPARAGRVAGKTGRVADRRGSDSLRIVLCVYSSAYINPYHHNDDAMLIAGKADANLNEFAAVNNS